MLNFLRRRKTGHNGKKIGKTWDLLMRMGQSWISFFKLQSTLLGNYEYFNNLFGSLFSNKFSFFRFLFWLIFIHFPSLPWLSDLMTPYLSGFRKIKHGFLIIIFSYWMSRNDIDGYRKLWRSPRTTPAYIPIRNFVFNWTSRRCFHSERRDPFLAEQ